VEELADGGETATVGQRGVLVSDEGEALVTAEGGCCRHATDKIR
jgi:hypothetical protein